MTFDLRKFERFCRELTVETKERGLQKLGTQLLGTQKYLMQEIGKGLEEGQSFLSQRDYASESALAYRMGKLHGMKFSVRKVEGGVRVWRTV